MNPSVLTLVIRMPVDPRALSAVTAALRVLEPYTTGLSQDDEMTVMDMADAHEDMPAHILDEARTRTSAFLAKKGDTSPLHASLAELGLTAVAFPAGFVPRFYTKEALEGDCWGGHVHAEMPIFSDGQEK